MQYTHKVTNEKLAVSLGKFLESKKHSNKVVKCGMLNEKESEFELIWYEIRLDGNYSESYKIICETFCYAWKEATNPENQ